MLCGPACLLIAAKSFGIEQYSLDGIAQMADWNYMDGTSLLGLESASHRMGLNVEGLNLEIDQLADLMTHNNAMAIIESQNHFYLLMKASQGNFLVVTTPVEPKWFQAAQVAEVWDGKALLLSRQPVRVHSPAGSALLLAGVTGLATVGVGFVCLAVKSRKRRKVKRGISTA
jgi:ABC-type bacteriocin/lantibiotic exporter with double-glycine peptidase domain